MNSFRWLGIEVVDIGWWTPRAQLIYWCLTGLTAVIGLFITIVNNVKAAFRRRALRTEKINATNARNNQNNAMLEIRIRYLEDALAEARKTLRITRKTQSYLAGFLVVMILGSFLYERAATSRLDKAVRDATDARSKVDEVIDKPPVVVTSISPTSQPKQTKRSHRPPSHSVTEPPPEQ